ncbi:MAG TPA: FliM/FliN family flagellar motor switch protein [Hyphomicrobiales bacterium]|nr:FliM/FliN family flagellar motor switch protein [Hyphomicrobiales bacterium]
MANDSETRTAQEIPVHVQGGGNGVMPLPLANIEGAALAAPKAGTGAALALEAMLDVPVTLVFEVCRIDIDIRQLLELSAGSHLELRQVSVDVIDIRLDDRVIASGETIAIKHHYGVRWGALEMYLGKEPGDE